ncbi:hypothetical protein BJF81_15655 [Ornithinimicrobium sp. CNJ-824]|uniref:three-Cys-motif partner protein TcmP n=1 Tax=Ornithinimicrobium sp. CNJ-824 TaxID=1904966 RepID=UPI00095C292F|nr:three-Cys-motif partner protein TcmP [Ornithinimicrobium sp. CNJ-824]OLT21168.1 hypothetical protein BJF81_15655 [Ornithinimicrobium sp. CNJ-824]
MVGPKDSPVWDIAPHTSAKHQIMRKYLGGWFPKLGMGTYSSGRVIFLDGFAGPGVYSDGTEGSPTIALRELMNHPSKHAITRKSEVVFIFNEKDKKRYRILEEQLVNLEAEYGGWGNNVRVHAVDASFDELVDELLDGIEGTGKKLAPTFAFVDPFGYKDVSIEKLARLLRYEKCELFIYFDFNSVQRFATAGNVDEAFNRLYGTGEFKQAPATGDPDRPRFLLELYERQLRDVVGFPYVQAFRMVNMQGKTNNYMIFCSRHLDGLDLMKKAMWSVSPTGDFKFEDRMAGQDILVGLDQPDLEPLAARLLAHFAGRTVPFAEVDRFVLTETPYHRGHLKQKTLGPMRKAKQLSTDSPSRGFPETCRITFVES